MGHRVVSAQQYPRIPLIARQLRSRRFPGPGLRALMARASNPPASAKHRGIGATAPLSEVVRSSSFSCEGLGLGVTSNGTVQAKTWNPNGLAAVANLPCLSLRTDSRRRKPGAGTASSPAPGERTARHGDEAVPAPFLNRPCLSPAQACLALTRFWTDRRSRNAWRRKGTSRLQTTTPRSLHLRCPFLDWGRDCSVKRDIRRRSGSGAGLN